MLGNFSCFCCHLLTFFKINYFKEFFRNTVRVLNGLDPDQDRHYVSPDLCPNCLQKLSADDKSSRTRKSNIRFPIFSNNLLGVSCEISAKFSDIYRHTKVAPEPNQF